MKSRLPPDALGRELILEFFWRFSVFECALKREGFLKCDRYGNAHADWTAFSKSLEGTFTDVTMGGFADAVAALTKLAPRRQVVRHCRLDWQPVPKPTDGPIEPYVVELLKVARNNLFHGGKYPDGPVHEVEQDQAILRAGTTILEGLCGLHSGVRRFIEEAA